MQMRVADFVFKYLADYGIKHVFLVTGGGAMHLNDALGREKRIKYVCTHHEQASAIAAEGYARTTGGLAVVNVTSGPGGTNTLTGVIGQWLDSVPVLYVSGQVKQETCISSEPGINLRQLGDQEINIIDIVKPVTKYAVTVKDPGSIKNELQRAIHIATSGRPGPVWLDIPLDVQGAIISEDELVGYKADELSPNTPLEFDNYSSLLEEINNAERPVIIAGHGIRIAGAEKKFAELIDTLKIPVLSTFNGFDLIPSDSDYFVGRIGTLGSRAGNFALQNADLIISIGSRNNIRQVSYSWESFGRHAKKIIVDIDAAELQKRTLQPDIPIVADAGIFIGMLLGESKKHPLTDKSQWLQWCLVRKDKYPVVLDSYKTSTGNHVHPYYFIDELTSQLPSGARVVAGNGTACVALFQAGQVKDGQRIFWNSGCASMGYCLPAAIGAQIASQEEVICITGDGSVQMNIQELETISHHRMPIKIIIFNNRGYRSISQTQEAFFDSHFIGCSPATGVSFPAAEKLADLYGFNYKKIDSSAGLAESIQKKIMAVDGPLICEVILSDDYVFAPKLSSEKKADGRIISKPLEDLYPFLDRDEFLTNMLVPAMKE